jgi:nucleoside phosphorylase
MGQVLRHLVGEIQATLDKQEYQVTKLSEFGAYTVRSSYFPATLPGWCDTITGHIESLKPFGRQLLFSPDPNTQAFNALDTLLGALQDLAGYYTNITTTPASTEQRKEALARLTVCHTAADKLLRHVATAPGNNAPSGDLPPYDPQQQPWYPHELPQSIEITNPAVLQPAIDVVILTVNETEWRAVMYLLKPYPRRKGVLRAYLGTHTYDLGRFGEQRTVVTRCEMGTTGPNAAMLATQKAWEHWRPRALIMCGVAFGRDHTQQRVGDVLVAQQVVLYEPQRQGDETIYRGPQPTTNATLFNRFRNPPRWSFARPDRMPCQIHYGQMLSGEKLIDNAEAKASLFRRYPEAIGGEMEGAGVWSAAELNMMPWIVVKAICDWGDGTKNSKHQPLAAAAAASLVHYVLAQRTVLNSLSKPQRA